MAVICYLCFIGIYTRTVSDPIIFFASVIIAALVTLICCLFLCWKGKGLLDHFMVAMMGMVYFMGVVMLAVFGPTFIDRSISYHIAFYAADMGKVDIETIRDSFSDEIFDKRIHDAVAAGVIKEDNGELVPTIKAEMITAVLKPLGKLTGSLDTYDGMKEEVKP